VRTGVGAGAVHRFVSDCDQVTNAGAKIGETAAASLAVRGLDPIVQWHLAKPPVTMDAAFGAQFDGRVRTVYGSEDDGRGGRQGGGVGWGAFWQQMAQMNPRVVGIDVEVRGPVQVSEYS
jgi:hypothetical protein